MAEPQMQLEIVTPEGAKLSAAVRDVTAPGAAGELDILPGHVPVLTVLDIGPLTYVDADGAIKKMALNGGYLEVDRDVLVVITETAEYSDEIDMDRARASLQRANDRLAKQEEGTASFEKARRSARRAQNRIAVAGGDQA